MRRNLGIIFFGLCLVLAFSLKAGAQASGTTGGNPQGSGEAQQLRQEIQALRQQAEPLRQQLEETVAKAKGLREQLRPIVDKIKEDREKLRTLREEGQMRHQQHQGQLQQPSTPQPVVSQR